MKAVRFDLTIPRYLVGLTLGKLFSSTLWNGLSCTALREIPEPIPPGSNWVKVKTRYGGICGSDLATIRLHTSPYYTLFSSFPKTLGHENVGTLISLPEDPGPWQVGDRVVVEPLLWCAPRGFTHTVFTARKEKLTVANGSLRENWHQEFKQAMQVVHARGQTRTLNIVFEF